MPIYRNLIELRAVYAATLEELWAYIDDREAQVELDPHIHRIDMVEGTWGEPGSRFVVAATLYTGESHTSEMELLEVERPTGYRTRTPFPDGVTIGTHRFREVEGGTEWHHTIDVTTRSLSMLEYVALLATHRRRRRATLRDHAEDSRRLATKLAAMRERRGD